MVIFRARAAYHEALGPVFVQLLFYRYSPSQTRLFEWLRWMVRSRMSGHGPAATTFPARSPSGKAKVCKTFIGGSIPPPRLQFLF